MKRKDPKLDLLRSVPGLAGCRDAQLQPLLRLMDELNVPMGHVLAHEGVAGREVFVIVEGTADVTLRGEHLASLGPGQFVGEMAVLDHSPRSATVTATSDMRLLAMDPSSFASLLDNQSVATGVATSLASRLRKIEGAPERAGQ